jgi:hypothetical protein
MGDPCDDVESRRADMAGSAGQGITAGFPCPRVGPDFDCLVGPAWSTWGSTFKDMMPASYWDDVPVPFGPYDPHRCAGRRSTGPRRRHRFARPPETVPAGRRSVRVTPSVPTRSLRDASPRRSRAPARVPPGAGGSWRDGPPAGDGRAATRRMRRAASSRPRRPSAIMMSPLVGIRPTRLRKMLTTMASVPSPRDAEAGETRTSTSSRITPRPSSSATSHPARPMMKWLPKKSASEVTARPARPVRTPAS